jgi:hypothetical protein
LFHFQHSRSIDSFPSCSSSGSIDSSRHTCIGSRKKGVPPQSSPAKMGHSPVDQEERAERFPLLRGSWRRFEKLEVRIFGKLGYSRTRPKGVFGSPV